MDFESYKDTTLHLPLDKFIKTENNCHKNVEVIINFIIDGNLEPI